MWVGFVEAATLLLEISLSGMCGFLIGGAAMCNRGIGGVRSLEEHGFPCLEDVGAMTLVRKSGRALGEALADGAGFERAGWIRSLFGCSDRFRGGFRSRPTRYPGWFR